MGRFNCYFFVVVKVAKFTLIVKDPFFKIITKTLKHLFCFFENCKIILVKNLSMNFEAMKCFI